MTHVTLSDLSKAIAVLESDLKVIESQQLALATDLYQLLRRQAELSARSRALTHALTVLTKENLFTKIRKFFLP